jgi:hypothetical protein
LAESVLLNNGVEACAINHPDRHELAEHRISRGDDWTIFDPKKFPADGWKAQVNTSRWD